MQLAQPQPQCCPGCPWCEKNKRVRFRSHVGISFTSKQVCFALKKFIEAIISSPNGVAEEEVWDVALLKGLPKWFLISEAILRRKLLENNLQMQRRKLFLRQQQQSSPLGGALFSAFPLMVLKLIASYLTKPSQALLAVSLGNFDMSSISATMSADTNRKSGHKRNFDGSLRKESIVCLADISAESLEHIASFLSGFSQALFGLSVAASHDAVLNKNSFAIVGDQWDYLDFGEIEKELGARLTDDDINAVLWCIDAANKVKRLSLAHCVNITGAGLESLRGSTIIEQIDLSLVGRHDEPTLLELWHPPRKMDSVVVPFDPPLSCAIVLPILDSIIGREQCSLQHLHFPKSWRANDLTLRCFRPTLHWLESRRDSYNKTFKPDPAFVHFLSRYNQVLMNRGSISCVNCSRDLHSSEFELVGSSVSAGDKKSFFTFGNQNQTCSQCMKHCCYRCIDVSAEGQFLDREQRIGAFLIERCDLCEKEQCVECSGMYQCYPCSRYYCMDCKESTTCHEYYCENKICSDCDLRRCRKCKEDFCSSCATDCETCGSFVCEECDDIVQECSNCDSYIYDMCNTCISSRFETCHRCKKAFCCREDDDYGCTLRRCLKCEERVCTSCSTNKCDSCESWVCDECTDFLEDCWCGGCDHDVMCHNCASGKTCQKCKRAFCGCVGSTTLCDTCNQRFCQDCVTFRRCDGIVPGRDRGCISVHCADCPEKSFVELARTCSEVNKEPCVNCRSMKLKGLCCVGCCRTSCETWKVEKKKLLDDQLNKAKKVSGGAGA